MAASTGYVSPSALFILNLFCVVPCVVLKIPQVWSLYTTKSARGISFLSILLELISYTVHILYMFVTAQPILQYAEYLFLVVQDMVVLLMILHYTDQITFILIPFSALYFAATAVIGANATPFWFISLLLALSTPVSVSGMVVQIAVIYKQKDSGSVSFWTWFISWATGALRIITSVLMGDMLVVFSYAIPNILRVIGCVAILYYQPSPKKFK